MPHNQIDQNMTLPGQFSENLKNQYEVLMTAIIEKNLENFKKIVRQEQVDINQPLPLEGTIFASYSGKTLLEALFSLSDIDLKILKYSLEICRSPDFLKKEVLLNFVYDLCKKKDLLNKHEIIKILLENNPELGEQLKKTVDINEGEKDINEGKTVLHFLAENPINEEKTIEFLVKEVGLNVNQQDKSGNTPLHIIPQSNTICSYTSKNIDCFLKQGADYSIKNSDGSTPIDIEFENRDHNMVIGRRHGITQPDRVLVSAIIKNEISKNSQVRREEMFDLVKKNIKPEHQIAFSFMDKEGQLYSLSKQKIEKTAILGGLINLTYLIEQDRPPQVQPSCSIKENSDFASNSTHSAPSKEKNLFFRFLNFFRSKPKSENEYLEKSPLLKP